MTCEICGQTLATKRPAEAVSDRLARGARGAQALKSAVANNDLRRLHRMNLTLHVVSMLDVGRAASVISANEREKVDSARRVDVGMTRPLLGAAIILRGKRPGGPGIAPHFSLASSGDRADPKIVAGP